MSTLDAVEQLFTSELPKPMAAVNEGSQGRVRAAADINNPSGLGWNGKTWKSYDTPEAGVADTQQLVTNYLNTPGRNTVNGLVGTWVTGKPEAGASVQNGAYAAKVRKELESAGVALNPDGTIPNTPQANDAITRAIIVHESAPQNVSKFLPHVGGGKKEDDIEKLFSTALASAPAEQPAVPPAAPVVAVEPAAPAAPVQVAPIAPVVEPAVPAAAPVAPVVAVPVAPAAVPVAEVVEQPSAVSQAAGRRFAEPQAAPVAVPVAPVSPVEPTTPTAPPAPRTFKEYAKETGKSVASFLDNTIGGVIPAAVGLVAHPLLKVVEATALATGGKFNAAETTHAIVDSISRPFAKAVGIDPEDPAYKRESVNRLMTWVGEHVGENSQVLSDKFYEQTGVRIPPSDFEYAANLGLAAVSGKAAPVAVKGVKGAIGALEEQFAAKKGEAKPVAERVEPTTVVSEAPGIRVEYPVDTPEIRTLSEKLDANRIKYDELNAAAEKLPENTPEKMAAQNKAVEFYEQNVDPLYNQIEALQPKAEKPKLTADQYGQLIEAEKAGATPEALQTMVEQFNAKKAAAEPVAPVGTVENQLSTQLEAKQSPIQVPAENPPMPTRAASTQDVAAKKDLLRSVGVETFRNSALEGNPKEASSQFITASADQGPYATGMTAQINHEKTALNNHFGKISEEAGGTNVRYGTPEEVSDKISSGAKIKSALEQGYKAHVAESKSLYKEAETVHGDKPVTVDRFSDFLKDDSNFAYANEKGLKNGINQYMSAKGLLDAEGNVKPMSIAQAEGVRQYINNKYHFETARLGGQMKGLIDNQVFEQVGGETYQKARAHWKKGIETYDNPKAVGDLLSDRGVNQKIADEAVTTKVAGLAESQFKHLVDTLRTDGQTAAVNEIKTSLVDQIRRSGESGVNQPWNSIAAAKTASKISEKLKVAFADDPKGLAKIYDGIEAGNVLHIPSRYPGAAVQTNLLKNKFSDIALQRGMSTAGASVGGFLGEGVGAVGGFAAGEYLGARLVGAKKTARQIKQLQSELTQKEKSSLSDMLRLTPKK
jgi:hypothetical protein